MSCIGCEGFAKRISNAFRDENIKENFENAIGYEVCYFLNILLIRFFQLKLKSFRL